MVNKLGKSGLFFLRTVAQHFTTKTLLIKIKVFWYASVWETTKAWEIGNQGLHDSTLLHVFCGSKTFRGR